MKKLIAIFLSLNMLTVSTYAEIKMNYVNDGMETTAKNYSLAGSSDPNYSLYINGEKIETTDEGYFCYYAPLEEGINTFDFDNTTDKKTYTITRKAVSSSEAAEDKFTTVDLVGEINRNHPTVRSYPDESDYDLITPYVKGTLVHIVAENSEYYRTANESYIYKESVNIVDKAYNDNTVKNIGFKDNELTFSMDRACEYAVDFTENNIKITLFDTKNGKKLSNPDTAVFSDASVGGTDSAIYTFNFKEKNKFIGFFASFDDNNFIIKFNEGTKLNGNSLEGVEIVIDAGHGGADTGTLGLGNIYEKTVNLAITKYLESYLKDKGATVLLTRDTDKAVALAERTAFINNTMPDISVSIHCDSRNEWEDFNENKGTLNLYTYDTPSEFVQKLSKYMDNAEYKKQNLALTRTTVCPAVLIETGYMSNPYEYEYLIKEKNQKAIAEKIGYAIEKYFTNKDNSSETIDILHTTDTHGNAEGGDGYIGYGKIAGYIDSIRAKNKNTLVLDSGDTYEGLPLFALTLYFHINQIYVIP